MRVHGDSSCRPFFSLYPSFYFPLCFDLFRVTVSTGNSPSKRPTHNYCHHARPVPFSFLGSMVYSVKELSEARDKIQLPCP